MFTEDKILPGLERQLDAQCVGPYWLAVQLDNGDIRTRTRGLMKMDYPSIEQAMFAREVTTALNKRCHMGGRWMVAWCDPVERLTHLGPVRDFKRFLAMWKDKDGDLCFTQDSEDPVERLFRDGVDRWIAGGFEAARVYAEFMHDAGIRPQDMIKRALGESSRALH